MVDSIGTGAINAVEPPYRIRIAGTTRMSPEVLEFLSDLKRDIADRIQHGVSQGWDARAVSIEFLADT